MHYFEIEGGAPLNGEVFPSGNKNEALPALMTCLLTDKPIILRNMPKIEDVLTACQILRELGVKVNWISNNDLCLEAPTGMDFKIPNKKLCTKIRASILLLGPMLARFKKVELPLPGGDVIGARRVDVHFECIEALGGKLELSDTIYGTAKKIKGTDIFLDEPAVTATGNALLMAVMAEGKTTIYNAACEPHIKGLCRLLCEMGAKISGIGTNHLTIEGVSSLGGADFRISSDFMEVSSFLCLGAITEGTMTIKDVVLEDMRMILKVFKRLGIEPEIKNKKFDKDFLVKLSTGLAYLVGNPNFDSMTDKYYARFHVKHQDSSDSYLRKAYTNLDLHTDGTYVKEKTDWLIMTKMEEQNVSGGESVILHLDDWEHLDELSNNPVGQQNFTWGSPKSKNVDYKVEHPVFSKDKKAYLFLILTTLFSLELK